MIACEIPAQGAHSDLVRSRRTADAQINAVWIECREGPKLFGDYKRRMVGQHDAAGTHPDAFSCPSHMANNDRGGGAGDTGHVMVFSEPEPAVAPFFSTTGQINGVLQRSRCVTPLNDRGKVENRKRCHAS